MTNSNRNDLFYKHKKCNDFHFSVFFLKKWGYLCFVVNPCWKETMARNVEKKQQLLGHFCPQSWTPRDVKMKEMLLFPFVGSKVQTFCPKTCTVQVLWLILALNWVPLLLMVYCLPGYLADSIDFPIGQITRKLALIWINIFVAQLKAYAYTWKHVRKCHERLRDLYNSSYSIHITLLGLRQL